MFESLSFTIRPFKPPLERGKRWLFPQESLRIKYFPTQWKWKLGLTSSSTSKMCPRHSELDSLSVTQLHDPSSPKVHLKKFCHSQQHQSTE